MTEKCFSTPTHPGKQWTWAHFVFTISNRGLIKNIRIYLVRVGTARKMNQTHVRWRSREGWAISTCRLSITAYFSFCWFCLTTKMECLPPAKMDPTILMLLGRRKRNDDVFQWQKRVAPCGLGGEGTPSKAWISSMCSSRYSKIMRFLWLKPDSSFLYLLLHLKCAC